MAQGTPPPLLPAARAGDADALGRLLDEFRAYLLNVAERELAGDLRAKGGASDLVQQTMLDAVHGFPAFAGASAAELRAWLRRLLLNNLVSFTRLYRDAAKRSVGREVALGEGSGPAVGMNSTPSKMVAGHEEAEALRRALDRLPADYRSVLHLRSHEGKSFTEVGQALGLTPNAARKLWQRAIRRLQQETGKA
jgi:RNA polymerase sigma-70 factor (ECF subfamily)